jgi:hypothetical protein
MIAVPQHWRAQLDGTSLIAAHPAGSEVATLRYDERLYPLLSPPELLAAQLSRVSGFAPRSQSAFERFATDEGEYAAAVTVEGALANADARVEIAWVIADDCYAQLLLLVKGREYFEEVHALTRQLVMSDRQLLGIRRRRYLYDAPAGWRSVARIGLRTDWFPGEDAASSSVITVWPAFPGPGTASAIVGRQIAMDRDTGISSGSIQTSPIVSDYGLSGTRWSLGSQPPAQLLREFVVFSDERFLYPLRLESTTADARECFASVVRSIRPIPAPHDQATAKATILFAHWSD